MLLLNLLLAITQLDFLELKSRAVEFGKEKKIDVQPFLTSLKEKDTKTIMSYIEKAKPEHFITAVNVLGISKARKNNC